MPQSSNILTFLSTLLLYLSTEETGASFLDYLDRKYEEFRVRHGSLIAQLYCVYQLIQMICVQLVLTVTWELIMLKNHLKIIFRNMKQQKIYSMINIMGLAGGIACCLLIFLYVHYEFSFDSFHEKIDRIHRIILERTYPDRVTHWPIMPNPLADALINDYPEVETATRVVPLTWGREGSDGKTRIHYQDKTILEPNVVYGDDAFFDVFSFHLLEGDPEKVLEQPNSVVITKEMAEKYFRNENPLGKVLTIDAYGGEKDFQVTGISENIPKNSHFRFNFLMSYNSCIDYYSTVWSTEWASFTYILLKENVTGPELEEKLPGIFEKYLRAEFERDQETRYDDYLAAGNGFRYFLQPLKSIHLTSHTMLELGANGEKKYVVMFAVVAVFILLLAFVNFVNLTTARSTKRAMEIGIRKTFGAFRGQIMKQFLLESLFYCGLALLTAFVAISLILPAFNNAFGKALDARVLFNLPVFLLIMGFTLFVGFTAGFYPALVMSSFNPIAIFKGVLRKGVKGKWLRNGLVVFQFTISIALITASFVISGQLRFMLNQDLGFDKDHVLVVENADLLGDQSPAFQNEIRSLSNVVSYSGSFIYPAKGSVSGTFHPVGSDRNQAISTYSFYSNNDDYLKTMGIDLVAGRTFSEKLASDSSAVILNEEAAKAFGFSDPVGQMIVRSGVNRHYMVIGLVRNFHFESLHHPIKPLLLYKTTRRHPTYIAIRLKPDDVKSTVSRFQIVWEKHTGNKPFIFSFLDQRVEAEYRTEQTVERLTAVFSLIAVVIGCLGLAGLSAYTAEMRTKEIGIRKVLGASVSQVIVLISKEYVKLVTLSILLAAPVSYFFLKRWLENFSYSMNLSAWIFIIAGGMALIAAFITTGVQTLNSAVAKPVDTLKYE